jgi:ABC-2 type transport system permease protein
VRPYLALFRARFGVLLQYRAAAIAGFGTQAFFGIIRIMILEAFYANGGGAQPMTLAQTVTYIWLGQAFFHLLPFSSNPDPEVRDMIRSGQVAYELTRPLDLYGLWLSRALAARLAPTLMRAVPMLVLALALLGMSPPPSLASGVAALVALALAACLTAALSTVITATLMWTTSGEGIARLMPSVALIGTGLVVPLPLFPDWAQPILTALPFRSMADDPFRIYVGLLPATALVAVAARQLAWIAAFVLLGRTLVARGQRRLVVQGG